MQSPPDSPVSTILDLWLRPVRPLARSEPAAEQLLARDERERASRFVDHESRTLFVLGRSFLRAVLATYLGCAPQALRLDQRCARCGAQHGKPRVSHPPSDLAFNLSHAPGLVALAVCRNREVGIDVEWRARAATMPEVEPLLLSPAEHKALEEVPATHRAQVLLECWVHKEALLKATGEGLSRDLRELALPLPSAGTAVYRRDGTWWGVRGVDVGPDHVGAVAVQESMPRVRYHSLTDYPVRHVDKTSER